MLKAPLNIFMDDRNMLSFTNVREFHDLKLFEFFFFFFFVNRLSFCSIPSFSPCFLPGVLCFYVFFFFSSFLKIYLFFNWF